MVKVQNGDETSDLKAADSEKEIDDDEMACKYDII
jgi:hypothetical protein